MAKQPSGRTIESYQSSLAGQSKNSTGIEKATNEAILSKTYNDTRIKQLQKEIQLEKEQLDIQKELLNKYKKAGASVEVIRKSKQAIADHEKQINKLNNEGVKYLENSVKHIKQITSAYQKQLEYQDASLSKKLEMKQLEANELQSRLNTLNVLRQEGKLTADMRKEREELVKKAEEAKNRQLSLQKSISTQEEKWMTYAQKRAAQEERIKNAREKLKEITIERDSVLNDINSTDEEKGLAIRKYNEQYKAVEGSVGSSATEQAAFRFFSTAGSKADKIIGALESLSAAWSKAREALDDAIDDAMEVYSKYLGSIDARLYGTDLTFTAMQKDIDKVIGNSAYVNQKKMIENLNKLTESGIAFNLEYRTWLETVSDKMVTTFDTLDSTLTRLVRLQQADISDASLGAEALMTRFLNSQFQDTSYLNNLYDTVAGELIDSTSQQSATNSIAYQFAIQKWLGALSSVGLSDSTVQNIAQALNWLGTGNVNQLNSNNSASTLLNLSAQKAGLSYADMLLSGTNADNINKLMKAMVIELQDISKNTGGNQVVKSAWSDILGISMSDIRAVNNLTNSDISSIYNTTADYSSAISELTNQTSYISKRTSTAELVDNVIQNYLFGIGSGIASSRAKYFTWKGTGLLSDFASNFGTIGTIISGISDVVGGVTVLGDVLRKTVQFFDNGVKGGTNVGGFSMQLYQSRGQGFTGVSGIDGGSSASSTQTGTSYSGVASTAASVNGTSSVNLATNANNTQSTTVSGVSSSGKTADDIYSMLFEKQTKAIKVNVTALSSSVIEKLAEAMNADAIGSIDEKLSGTINTTIDNYSDVYANTVNTIRYVQGL